MYKEKLKKVAENIYELPKEGKMNVPGKILISEKLLEALDEDSVKQVMNVAQLPGIVGYSLALSDAHTGYGFCIGGVAAMDVKKGVISPGGIGYDINCSVRLLRTNLFLKDINGKENQVAAQLYRDVPSGVGRKGRIILSSEELEGILKEGAQWAVKNGYGVRADYLHTEEQGKIPGANPSVVSQKAKARGRGQLGSLGAGNHFLEVQLVESIFNKEAAKVFGLKENQIVIMIHCGSRGLGHQVASDYIKLMEDEYGWKNLPDRQLICAPIDSKLGKNYYAAMAAAANFAFANKQLITHWVREAMKRIFPNFEAEVLYDVCHNIAKFEEQIVDGKKKEILIMRKGATRSFGPGRKEIPTDYRIVGQPILIPGSMGTASYVLVGTKKAEEISLASTPHGAGRVMSRTKAIHDLSIEHVKQELEKNKVVLMAGSKKGIAEEAPEAYKDVDEVARVSNELGIGNLVARLKPLAVMKG